MGPVHGKGARGDLLCPPLAPRTRGYPCTGSAICCVGPVEVSAGVGPVLVPLTGVLLTGGEAPVDPPAVGSVVSCGDGHLRLEATGPGVDDLVLGRAVVLSRAGGRLVRRFVRGLVRGLVGRLVGRFVRSEEHTSELQSRFDLVCRLLLEKKK